MSRIVLSKGLAIRARQVEGGLKTNVDLTMAGSLYEQLEDLTFFLAAAGGAPLIVNGHSTPPLPVEPADWGPLTQLQERIRKMVSLLDSMSLSPELARSLDPNPTEQHHLLMLHRALIEGEEVQVSTDGVGRMNVTVGRYQIVVLVFEGADGEHYRIVDPFSPDQRDRLYFRQTSEDGGPKIVRRATLYEALDAEDLGRTLNLHVRNMAEAYERLEDRSEALSMANQVALELLRAADTASEPARDYLLQGADNLTAWLMREGGGDLVYSINYWQTQLRMATPTSVDRVQIRQARREIRTTAALEPLQEACFAILLDEPDELAVVLAGLSGEDREMLVSWPIWSLAQHLNQP
jgi:hypothetical protein